MERKARSLLLLFVSIVVLTAGSVQANSKIDKFTACKLYVLLSNCNIGRDTKAPPFMRRGGPASCFVGLDIAPKDDENLRAPFRQIISDEKYTRKSLEGEIKEIEKCLVSPEAFDNCDIGFIAAGGMKTVKHCQ